ncbi:MAG: hypothetical protein KDK64_04135, partial [Chlamydiia bacterium]|nr:hypothetical protein [Chlamydiia bacterium]
MEALDPTIETFVQESFQEIFNRIAPEEENSTAKTIHIAIKLFTSYSPQPIKIAASFDAKLLLTKNEDGDTILDTLVDNDN